MGGGGGSDWTRGYRPTSQTRDVGHPAEGGGRQERPTPSLGKRLGLWLPPHISLVFRELWDTTDPNPTFAGNPHNPLCLTKKQFQNFLQIETRRNGSNPHLIGMGLNQLLPRYLTDLPRIPRLPRMKLRTARGLDRSFSADGSVFPARFAGLGLLVALGHDDQV